MQVCQCTVCKVCDLSFLTTISILSNTTNSCPTRCILSPGPWVNHAHTHTNPTHPYSICPHPNTWTQFPSYFLSILSYLFLFLFHFVLRYTVATCFWHLRHLDKPVVVYICVQDHLYPCQPSFTAWMTSGPERGTSNRIRALLSASFVSSN